MKQAIILIGPGTGLYNLSTIERPHFTIPILGISILGRNILWLSECCNEIFIVGLSHYQETVKNIIKKIQNKIPQRKNNRPIRDNNLIFKNGINIYYISIKSYDGSIISLNNLKKYIEDDFIVSKGNIITNIPLSEFLNRKIFTVMTKQPDSPLIGYNKDIIYIYDTEFKLKLKNITTDLTLTSDLDTSQLYFFDKSIVDNMDHTLFSIKNSIPTILNERPLKFVYPDSLDFINIKTIDDFVNASNLLKNQYFKSKNKNIDKESGITDITNLREYHKNKMDYSNLIEINESKIFIYNNKIKKISFNENKNIVGLHFQNNGYVQNIITGDYCQIGDNSFISNSIFMDNVIIGKNCRVEDSVIGYGVIIPDNSKIVRCKVSPKYIFKQSVNIENVTFNKIDFRY